MKTRLYFLFCVLFLSGLINTELKAQWSDDPFQNQLLTSPDSTYAYGEWRMNPNDSSYYLLYYDRVDDQSVNYQLYLQKFNFHGERQWEQPGIVVDDAPNPEWVTTIGLTFDTDNTVYVGYSYVSDGNTQGQIHVNAISADGTRLWGDHGINISDGTGIGDYEPVLVINSNGNLVISYEHILQNAQLGFDVSQMMVKSLSPEGEILWSYAFDLQENHMEWGNQMVLVDDYVMCIYKDVDILTYMDTSFMFDQVIVAQQFDNTGTPVFDNPKTVFTYVTYYLELPMMNFKLTSDNNGGFYLGTFYSENSAIQMFVQHFDENAEVLFSSPVGVSTFLEPDLVRAVFGLASLSTTGDVVVGWVEEQGTSVNQTSQIRAQKISTTGERLWGDEGLSVLEEVSTLDENYGWVNVESTNDNHAMLFYMHYFNEDQTVGVACHKMDADGQEPWPLDVALSAKQSIKTGLEVTPGVDNQWVAFWIEQADTSANPHILLPYAQNITSRGSIGTGIFNHNTTNTILSTYPNPANQNLWVKLSADKPMDATLNLTDVSGRTIISSKLWKLVTGENTQCLDVSILNPGMYIVEVTIGMETIASKVQVY